MLTPELRESGSSFAPPLEHPHAQGSWYALTVKHKFEHSVATHLHHRGFDTFLPVYRAKRQWSDRVKVLDLPLFAGYVFCQFDSRNRRPIDSLPGVIGVVSFGRTLAEVELRELDSIRAVTTAGMVVQPWPFLGVGRRVTIERGPLKGLEGTIDRAGNACRLVLTVNILNRSVAVEVDREWVAPC